MTGYSEWCKSLVKKRNSHIIKGFKGAVSVLGNRCRPFETLSGRAGCC